MPTWADQHPDACHDLVDSTITVADDDTAQRWALPAGWVGIVNALHVDLLELIGTYQVERVVTNKMSCSVDLNEFAREPVSLEA